MQKIKLLITCCCGILHTFVPRWKSQQDRHSRFIAVLVMFLGGLSCYAQHNTQIAHYEFGNVLYNPASAGKGEKIEAIFIQRSQYMGFEGSPSTWMLSLATPFQVVNTKHGISLFVESDKIGNFDNIAFNFGYAYHHALTKGTLSVGFAFGGISYQLKNAGEWSDNSNDPVVPQQSEAASSGFDFNFGAFYKAKDWHFSASCLHVNEAKVLNSSGTERSFRIKRAFFLYGGYDWQTPISELQLSPNALFSFTNLAKPQFAFGGRLLYKGRYWGGLSYRIKDALGAMLGMSIGKDFRIGVAYEYSLSKLIGVNSGNLELFASYSFEVKFSKKEKRYKSLRFL
ncbi:MAG: PorP/SprF family type IX secretion system membrane protein [Bacteroidales bacterium]